MVEQSKKNGKKLNLFKPIAIIIIFILLVLVGIAGWLIFKTKQQVNQLQIDVTQNQTSISTQQNQLLQTQNSVSQLTQLSGYNRSEWILPEVKYLVNLADINITANQNVKAAILLLKAADKRLSVLANPKFNKLRQALINDINALASVPTVDTTGILLQLDAISSQVQKAKFIPSSPKTATDDAKEQTTNPGKANTLWQKIYINTLAFLEKAVIIRHHDSDVKPVLTAMEQQYLLQNIGLYLEEAKWAVLHKDQANYLLAVQKVEQLLKQGFAHNLTAVQNVLDALQSLSKLNINPKLPELTSIKLFAVKVSS